MSEASTSTLRVTVLASGRGSNFEALLRAPACVQSAGSGSYTVAALVVDRECPAEALAERAGVRSIRVERGEQRRADWEHDLAERVAETEPDLIVLAGFMRILKGEMLTRFRHRIINLHPSLLPAFPGRDAIGQSVRGGVCIAGCTVHLVDEGVDSGPILAQREIEVLTGDNEEALQERVKVVEHILYPEVLDRLCSGQISL